MQQPIAAALGIDTIDLIDTIDMIDTIDVIEGIDTIVFLMLRLGRCCSGSMAGCFGRQVF